ncbi:hypothetical protein GQ43DRAFT_443248 [Delitschia confertaspora ATCC 74209]|uniref:RNase III domain-containing protein n=1 Tax=Delitschia confertaspora ATCC 74209 TaxID=1513339 RepID=A0A9P4JL93_9PLEO|nr:hypothetical protein GQ43DRAFT_443248 [Delitschia confertaspora ATCC 74209]
MASKRPIRSLISTANSAVRSTRQSQHSFTPSSSSACTFSTSTTTSAPEYDTEAAPRPRWQQTPARMVAPYRIRPLPAGPELKVNDDPRKLDEVYVRMLGQSGDKVLSEEAKWLAVTHKSFDHGRRGFNDRLAYLGRRIVSLQTSLALMSGPQTIKVDPKKEDQYGRKPFVHPALSGLQGLTHEAKHDVLNKTRLANLGRRYGLDQVMRWKPMKADNLQGSGADLVLTTTIYAIVGAISLERGGEVANRVVKDKILNPLGFTTSAS